MPLIFWTKMNDIRFALWLFSSAGRLRKTIHPSPSNSLCRLTTPFSPLYLVAQKWWSDASLDGVCPKRNTFTGVHLPSLGRVISFRSPVFPFFAGRSSDKNKAYRPRFTGWSNRFLPQNKFVTFSDFASFYLSVCTMLKTHSEARKTVLNFQRRFGCFIG
ncbi:hypothetical protein J4727_20320 [Providencia rettgeri]|uniref:Uncharacterized protein n=1 Tax=Providencia rettgeri TaxID=587 RepID=A0A939SR91_PRORE|nr:hypothetical protein [Providencia rettgeri]